MSGFQFLRSWFKNHRHCGDVTTERRRDGVKVRGGAGERRQEVPSSSRKRDIKKRPRSTTTNSPKDTSKTTRWNSPPSCACLCRAMMTLPQTPRDLNQDGAAVPWGRSSVDSPPHLYEEITDHRATPMHYCDIATCRRLWCDIVGGATKSTERHPSDSNGSNSSDYLKPTTRGGNQGNNNIPSKYQLWLQEGSSSRDRKGVLSCHYDNISPLSALGLSATNLKKCNRCHRPHGIYNGTVYRHAHSRSSPDLVSLDRQLSGSEATCVITEDRCCQVNLPLSISPRFYSVNDLVYYYENSNNNNNASGKVAENGIHSNANAHNITNRSDQCVPVNSFYSCKNCLQKPGAGASAFQVVCSAELGGWVRPKQIGGENVTLRCSVKPADAPIDSMTSPMASTIARSLDVNASSVNKVPPTSADATMSMRSTSTASSKNPFQWQPEYEHHLANAMRACERLMGVHNITQTNLGPSPPAAATVSGTKIASIREEPVIRIHQTCGFQASPSVITQHPLGNTRPRDLGTNISQDLANDHPHDLRNNLPHDLGNNHPHDLRNNLPHDFGNNLPHDLGNNLQYDLGNDRPHDFGWTRQTRTLPPSGKPPQHTAQLRTQFNDSSTPCFFSDCKPTPKSTHMVHCYNQHMQQPSKFASHVRYSTNKDMTKAASVEAVDRLSCRATSFTLTSQGVGSYGNTLEQSAGERSVYGVHGNVQRTHHNPLLSDIMRRNHDRQNLVL